MDLIDKYSTRVGLDIFKFSATADLEFNEIWWGVLNALNQVCLFLVYRKTKMAVIAPNFHDFFSATAEQNSSFKFW